MRKKGKRLKSIYLFYGMSSVRNTRDSRMNPRIPGSAGLSLWNHSYLRPDLLQHEDGIGQGKTDQCDGYESDDVGEYDNNALA